MTWDQMNSESQRVNVKCKGNLRSLNRGIYKKLHLPELPVLLIKAINLYCSYKKNSFQLCFVKYIVTLLIICINIPTASPVIRWHEPSPRARMHTRLEFVEPPVAVGGGGGVKGGSWGMEEYS